MAERRASAAARFGPRTTVLAALQRTLGHLAALDSSDVSRTRGASRIRRGMAALFGCYGILLALRTIQEGNFPTVGQVFMVMIAMVLLVNRIGQFLRDWTLVVLGFFAYILAGNFAQQLTLDVHYLPQLRADEVLGFGAVPTVWLQQHLYHGTTGVLELFALAMYVSHFLLPMILGFYLWWSRRRTAFQELMFGLLAVSVLAEITFILAPTAPPWLAAKHGLLPPVHDIIRQSLFDVHLDGLGRILGDSSYYNTVAALPSLHAAFPIVALLVLVKHRMSRRLIAFQSAVVLAVVFSIVYSGEHYVVDALVGAVYAAVAWALVRRALASAPVAVPSLSLAAAEPALARASVDEPTV
jgi:hypothetical protein